MLITDLNHLSTASDAAVAGGRRWKRNGTKVQFNVARVTQVAISKSIAVTKYGDATAYATAINESDIDQDN